MSSISGILLEQIARLAMNNRAAAMALLPTGVRAAVTALENIPNMRERLDAQWAELNNAIEADWSRATPAQRASVEARMRQKRAHLDAAQASLNQIDGVLTAAASALRTMGIPVPGWPLMPRGINGLGALPAIGIALIIVAAAIGGAIVLGTFASFSRELAAAGRVSLGLDPAPPPSSGGLATVGIAGLAIAGVVAFALMRGGGR